MTGHASQRRAAALLLGPFLVLFATTYVITTIFAVYQSLFGIKREGAFGPPKSAFIGFGNYVAAFESEAFRDSCIRVVLYGIGPGLTVLVGGLAMALLIDSIAPGQLHNFFRLTAFVPFAVPVSVGAILWGFLYAPSTGPISALVNSTAGLHVNLLSGDWIMASVANIAVWTFAGYNMMIYLAALSSIDATVYEAAAMDGAGPLRVAWSIKLPLLRPAITLTVVFHFIGTMQLFTEPAVLHVITNAITGDWTPNMLAFQEASANNYSYAAAISVILALLAGGFSVALMRLLWRPAR